MSIDPGLRNRIDNLLARAAQNLVTTAVDRDFHQDHMIEARRD